MTRLKSPLERAAPHTERLQVRSLDPQAEVAHFTGYASTVGVPYEVRDWLGEYSETMAPGAFTKTLREKGTPGSTSGVPLLLNHDQSLLLANTSSATSTLEENTRGLKNDAQLDMRQTLGRDTAFALDRGDLSKMSFSFRGIKDVWNDTYDVRTVTECALYDTSIVLSPANPTTTAELREMMRSAMGREGRSLWASDTDRSIRSSLPVILQHRSLDSDQEELLEQALRALEAADGAVASRAAEVGRARTYRVAQAMLELRKGRALSTANEALLKQAAAALTAADQHHAGLADSHATAAGKIQKVLSAASAAAQSQDGKSNGTPPGNGNPINPQDGAGPRSLPPAVAQARQKLERLKRGERDVKLDRLRRDLERPAAKRASVVEEIVTDSRVWGLVKELEQELGLKPHGDQSRAQRLRAVQEIRALRSRDLYPQVQGTLARRLDEALTEAKLKRAHASVAQASLRRQMAAQIHAQAKIGGKP